MQRLSLEEFELAAEAFDAVVYDSPDIDRFCSGSDWVFPCRETWGTALGSWIARWDAGYAAFLRFEDALGRRTWIGFDTMWGFACPLVGPDPEGLAEEFSAAMRDRSRDWFALLVPGLPPGSRLHRALEARLREFCFVRRGPGLRRWVASLEGGMDAFLSRRTAKLRENLRRARRRAREAGVGIETAPSDDAAPVMARIRAVESRSWKGLAGTGLMSADLFAFYERMCERVARRGGLRAMFARLDGEDVGYILGGVRGSIYRGFQLSFDRRFPHLSLGSVLQLDQIEALCEEGIGIYDMGIDLPYKRRWADEPFDTEMLVVVRR